MTTELLIGAELVEPGQRLTGVNHAVVSLLLVAGLVAACGVDPGEATGSNADPGAGDASVPVVT